MGVPSGLLMPSARLIPAPEVAPSLGARLALSGAMVLLLRVLVYSAWQCDDAYITHRSAANWIAGFGPVFNPGERVQAYTHPLWMVVSTVCQLVTGEAYFSVIAVSIGLCVATAWVLATRVAADAWTGALAVLALTTAGGFVDYGVSGLESPLHFLLVVLSLAMADLPAGRRTVAAWSLLCATAALVLPDAVLLFAPAAAVALHRGGPLSRTAPAALLGALPLVAWEAFSLTYYGSLVPNTALAKLNLDVPAAALAARGFAYLQDSLVHDPITLVAALFGTGIAITRGRAVDRALAIGLLVSLVYVVRVGGDFMSGRFVAAPGLLGLGLLVRLGAASVTGAARGIAALCVVLYGLLLPGTRWLTDGSYGVDAQSDDLLGPTGVADERGWYCPSTGLIRVLANYDTIVARGLPVPPDAGAIEGAAELRRGTRLIVTSQMGYFGYFAGPTVHIVDPWSLGDPLLARLPFRPTGPWRVGHYERSLPAGYLDSLRADENLETDPAIARLYDDVRLITRGPLFTSERLAAILRRGQDDRDR